jgi:alpha-mannosidase
MPLTSNKQVKLVASIFMQKVRWSSGASHWLSVLLAGGAVLFVALRVSAQTASTTNKPTLYYIPHTHWEGAVFKTREGYLEMGLPHILQALQLLKEYPDYKFALDQVAYFKPFLERYPEEAAAFRKLVAEGRLEIVGGMDVMPDVVKPGGELFVRQMQYGKRYCREQLGVEVTVAWLLDTFGHHPQIPQLLRQAGFESFWFCRGVPDDNLPSEFRWRGIDGTEIPAFWLPGFYGLFYGPPRDLPGFTQFFRNRFDSLTSHARGNERVGLAGVDVCVPEDYVPPLIAQFNRQANAPFTIRHSVPSEFAAVVAGRRNQPVLTNDFNPIFQGTYSSRIELKQTTRRIEQLLLTAEKLSALADWLGPLPHDLRSSRRKEAHSLRSEIRNPGAESSQSLLASAATVEQMLWRAWEPVLFNQTHDLASGVMTDVVYEDTLRSYDFSRRLAEEVIESRWESITARIDTRGEGVPVVVFNPLGWQRTDAVEVEVGFGERSVLGVDLMDAARRPAPVQILEAERDNSAGITRARITFVARDVPALGWAIYRVLPRRSASNTSETPRTNKERAFIENEYYRATFDFANGAMTSLLDKSQEWEALAGPANVVAREVDKGDLWELYRGLDGASHVAMTNQQPVPKPGAALFTSEYQGTNAAIRYGPVFSEFSIAHAFANGSFGTRVRLYAGVRRVDIETELVNNEKYVRYQALFPTSIKNGRNVQEIPFGAIERPVGIEFPAQHWVDYSDGQHGIALLNFGLPGNLVSQETLLLSLLRSHNLGAYGFGGGYEPGMSSETGFELGKKRTFQYALVPHRGDWRDAAVYRAGLEFNHPFHVRKATTHVGRLPNRWGLLETSPGNVVLTALKPGPGGAMVLRVYEADGKATAGAKIKMHSGILAAYEANLLEDPGRKLRIKAGAVEFDLHPFEIKTIQLQLRPAKL